MVSGLHQPTNGDAELCYPLSVAHSITLNLSDEAWEDLIEASAFRHQSPEKVAEILLSDVVSDRLMRLASCLEFPNGDVGARHDEYIGASILAESERD